MPALLRKTADCRALRISPDDTNYMVCIVDPVADGASGVTFTAVVEIFEPGGKTPPHAHRRAQELFFVLDGEGIAHCDGDPKPISKGDAIAVLPGTNHVVENTGNGKLYTLTVMVPNEEFAELLHKGTEVLLDDEDRRVISGVV